MSRRILIGLIGGIAVGLFFGERASVLGGRAVSLTLVFLSPLALPPEKGGAFYATSATTEEPQIDWIDLYIPSNPLRSLANNVVPAVVVFSVLFGIALLGLPDKARILGPLRLVNDTLGRAGGLLVDLTPIGILRSQAMPRGGRSGAMCLAGGADRLDEEAVHESLAPLVCCTPRDRPGGPVAVRAACHPQGSRR